MAMALQVSNISVQILILITVTFYASLTLVIIAKTNLIDIGMYVSKKLHFTTVSMGDLSWDENLKIPSYSAEKEFRIFNIPERNSINSRLSSGYHVQKEEATSFALPNVETKKKLQSTCSIHATERGPHQFVVAFSYFGEFIRNRNYFQGIEENAKLIKKFYPNWVMRIYTNVDPPLIIRHSAENIVNKLGETPGLFENRTSGVYGDCICQRIENVENQEEMCRLRCTYPWLDFCSVKYIPGFGNLLKSQPQIWRFLPMADPLVDIFVSRDLDSRPSEREAAAVREWLSSNLTFHSMRDHPLHVQHFMGGMWGAVISKNRKELSEMTKRIMEQGLKRASRGQDQVFLKEIIWPFSNGSVLQHDSYNCLNFSEHGNMNPWPTKRLEEPYNFVGSRIGMDKKPLTKECPSSCRPKDKPNWIYC